MEEVERLVYVYICGRRLPLIDNTKKDRVRLAEERKSRKRVITCLEINIVVLGSETSISYSHKCP